MPRAYISYEIHNDKSDLIKFSSVSKPSEWNIFFLRLCLMVISKEILLYMSYIIWRFLLNKQNQWRKADGYLNGVWGRDIMRYKKIYQSSNKLNNHSNSKTRSYCNLHSLIIFFDRYKNKFNQILLESILYNFPYVEHNAHHKFIL